MRLTVFILSLTLSFSALARQGGCETLVAKSTRIISNLFRRNIEVDPLSKFETTSIGEKLIFVQASEYSLQVRPELKTLFNSPPELSQRKIFATIAEHADEIRALDNDRAQLRKLLKEKKIKWIGLEISAEIPIPTEEISGIVLECMQMRRFLRAFALTDSETEAYLTWVYPPHVRLRALEPHLFSRVEYFAVNDNILSRAGNVYIAASNARASSYQFR
jgi:hypothetical protein